MLYILTGDDKQALRNFVLAQTKAEGGTLHDFKSTDASVLDVLSKYLTTDLLGSKTSVLLELLPNSSAFTDSLLQRIQAVSSNTLYLLPSSLLQLEKALLTLPDTIKPARKHFDVDLKPNSFALIDGVIAGRRKEAYNQLIQLATEKEDPIKTFNLLLYGVRNIAYAVFDSPEFAKLKPFVQTKTHKQASRFTSTSIKGIYAHFYKLDLALKTGGVPSDMLLELAVEKIL